MKILRDHPIPLFIAVLALILAGVLLNHAWEQNVTLRGRGTRNFFGKGRFEGTVSISGLAGLEEEQAIVLSFLKGEGHVSLVDESGEVHAGGKMLGPVIPSRDYSEFVWVLTNEVRDDGASHGGGLLISGPAGRETAFALAAKLTKGLIWEPIFTEERKMSGTLPCLTFFQFLEHFSASMASTSISARRAFPGSATSMT